VNLPLFTLASDSVTIVVLASHFTVLQKARTWYVIYQMIRLLLKNSIAFGISILFTISGFTSEKIQIRFDPKLSHLLPAHCRGDSEVIFNSNIGLLYFSTEGAIAEGFTHELNISSGALHKLYRLFDPHRKPNRTNKERSKEKTKKDGDFRLKKYIEIIESNFDSLGFRLLQVGDIMEILAMVLLRQIYPPDKYFITHSASYSGGIGRLGELDILIGNIATCEIKVVGEIKSSASRFEETEIQLNRFIELLKFKMNGNLEHQLEPAVFFDFSTDEKVPQVCASVFDHPLASSNINEVQSQF
jgi:hypothetical protein